MNTSNSIRNIMKAMDSSTSVRNVMKAMDSSSSFQKAMESLAVSENFQIACQVTNNQLGSTEISTEDNVVESHLEEIGNSNNSSDFLRAFTKIPPLFQLIMLYLVIELFLPVTLNIASNMATPYVESLISSSNKPNRELIKDIASISIDNIDLEQQRFVTVEILHLRKKASTKSVILDHLRLGQILTVVSKSRNWLEVTYNYDDGEIMQGWVFARYTAKFNK